MGESSTSNGRWRKSSYCDVNSCVEVAGLDGLIWVRNSEQPSTMVAFTRMEWAAFVGGVRNGEFDYLTAGQVVEPW